MQAELSGFLSGSGGVMPVGTMRAHAPGEEQRSGAVRRGAPA
jgi:hypothetical protein